MSQLTDSELAKVRSILGREPNQTEVGIFTVMWSEHCSYKSSRLHLKKLPTKGPRVLVGPGENAGIIDIGRPGRPGYAIAFKIESHNHPSFIEPFQGAATGVGGILRDIFTMGARPIAVLDAIRFGPLDDPAWGDRNRRILEGVVGGIAHYGNCFGVPTVGGECVFEPCYNGNPLVNVFALGVFRHDEIFFGRATGIGNPVIYVGAKTGRDGIHGASMASAVFTEESKEKRPNVQVGDPFMEKLLLEACLEAMHTGAVVGIQDMGAAGLTCSTCEMGSRAGTGVEIDLSLVPQRETGMTPYEIMLSESQERMLIVADAGRENEVFAVFKKWGLDAVTIGRVTDDGMLRVKNHGVVVAEIPNRELADEAPLYDRPHNVAPYRTAPLEAPEIPVSRDLTADLLKLLASADVCSKRWIWQQYDHTVRTNTLAGPGGDAAIVRIKETGTSIAMSVDGNSRYCSLSPREGARFWWPSAAAISPPSGALPVAATNNLNFGNPERPEIMAQLVEAIEGIAEACRFFETPITGGNVSLYNETLGESIWPTPVMGIVGLLKTAPPVTIPFKHEGACRAAAGRAGLRRCHALRRHAIRQSCFEPRCGDCRPRSTWITKSASRRRCARSSTPGLPSPLMIWATAAWRWRWPNVPRGGIGASRQRRCQTSAPNSRCSTKAPSRILVSTVDPEAVEEIARAPRCRCLRIGVTMKERLRIDHHSATWVDSPVDRLREVWENALEELLAPAYA